MTFLSISPAPAWLGSGGRRRPPVFNEPRPDDVAAAEVDSVNPVSQKAAVAVVGASQPGQRGSEWPLATISSKEFRCS